VRSRSSGLTTSSWSSRIYPMT